MVCLFLSHYNEIKSEWTATLERKIHDHKDIIQSVFHQSIWKERTRIQNINIQDECNLSVINIHYLVKFSLNDISNEAQWIPYVDYEALQPDMVSKNERCAIDKNQVNYYMLVRLCLLIQPRCSQNTTN